MVFVERDAANKIVGTYTQPQPGRAEEAMADDDPEVLAFIESTTPPEATPA